MKLIEKKCVPCEGEISPFTQEQIQEHLVQLREKWEVVDEVKIKKQYMFADFQEAMEFVNKVAELAEKEQHHPVMRVAYNKVGIELTTHAIRGLSENDFIMAAKIDQLLGKQ